MMRFQRLLAWRVDKPEGRVYFEAWLTGATGTEIARKHGVTQSRVSGQMRKFLRDAFGRPMSTNGAGLVAKTRPYWQRRWSGRDFA